MRTNKTGKKKRKCQRWVERIVSLLWRCLDISFLDIYHDLETKDYYTDSHKRGKVHGISFDGLKSGHDDEG